VGYVVAAGDGGARLPAVFCVRIWVRACPSNMVAVGVRGAGSAFRLDAQRQGSTGRCRLPAPEQRSGAVRRVAARTPQEEIPVRRCLWRCWGFEPRGGSDDKLPLRSGGEQHHVDPAGEPWPRQAGPGDHAAARCSSIQTVESTVPALSVWSRPDALPSSRYVYGSIAGDADHALAAGARRFRSNRFCQADAGCRWPAGLQTRFISSAPCKSLLDHSRLR